MLKINAWYIGDAFELAKQLPDESIQTIVTSPPYWGLRDYGEAGQLGLEKTPEEYVEKIVVLFRELRRALRDNGTLWLNLGDSYCSKPSAMQNPRSYRRDRRHRDDMDKRAPGLKLKDLVGIPWLVALALRADGWYLRQDIIWHKPNPMPESVTDRCTKAHEYIFLLTKSPKYYYNAEAIKEKASENTHAQFVAGAPRKGDLANAGEVKGNSSFQKATAGYVPNRNKRSVWTIPIAPYRSAHFSTFPPKLVEPCIKAGCSEGGTVLDPFAGSGTTLEVAHRHGCKWIGFEISEDYGKLIAQRMGPLVAQVTLF